MKKIGIRKVALLAVLVAIVVLTGLLIQQLCLPVRAYAEEQSETTVVGAETFADMRSEALGLNKVYIYKNDSEAEKERKQAIIDEQSKIFANWDFQDGLKTANEIDADEVSEREKKWEGNAPETENQNFKVISAENVAQITDARYGVTLGEEANAITLYKDDDGNLCGPKITESSSLTVFTYGQGSTLAHWSNAKDIVDENGNSGYKMFSYDPDSLIETLRRQTDADVYVAKTTAVSVSNGDDYRFEVTTQDGAELLLYKLEANGDSYGKVEFGLNVNTSDRVTRIEDMTKHNIILFDSNNPEQYHNFVYNELNIILTQISYDYLLTIGQVPKISMTSHSTGGVWNMMWANEHPFNVKDMFPIASPFNGSTMGQLFDTSWGKIKETLVGGPMGELHNMITCPSGIDNVDEIRYNYLHKQWEEAVKQNGDLKCYAFTGLTSIDLIEDMAIPGFSESDLGKSYLVQLFCVSVITQLAAAVTELIVAGVIEIAAIAFGPLGYIAINVVLVSIAAYLIYEIIDIVEAFGDVGQYALDNLMLDKSGDLCLMDDGLVDYNSALGYKPILEVGEDEDRREEWYSNFIRFEKTYRPDNTDTSKKTTENIAVPHNLESQDAFVISNISQNIEMGKPEVNAYVTSKLADGTISIDGIRYLLEFKEHGVLFPNSLYGKQVTQIGVNILKNNADIKFIGIGENVNYIGDSAFSGMTALTKVNLEQSLVTIGEQAFQGATSLTAIDIPVSVEEIGSGAFENCENLEEVNLVKDPSTVCELCEDNKENCLCVDGCLCETDVSELTKLKFVGADAFVNTEYTNTTDSVILGKVLIKYVTNATYYKVTNGDGISYFAQKCFANSQLETLDVSEFEFENNTIPDYFVYGAQNLSSVILPDGIIIIGNHSFEETTGLKELTLPESVEAIFSEAFKNSGIETLTAFNSYPPVISKDAFNGIDGLNVYVKAYAVSDFENSWASVADNDVFNFVTYKINLNFIDELNGNCVVETDYFGYLQSYDWLTDDYNTKEGYYFSGWFTTPEYSESVEDKRYFIGSLLEFELDEPCNLYARWELVTYNVWYENYGGTSNNQSTATILDELELTAAEKVGYDFVGWYDNSDFNGDALPNILNGISSDIKLYAKYTPKYYVVNYDTEGISVDRTYDSFAYGERFYAPVPVKENCAFSGWYDADGNRITGINGISIKKNYFTQEVTLYAQWTTKSFVIEFNDGTNSYVWGQDGLTSNASSVLLGQQVNVNDETFGEMFKREGYMFSKFVDQNGNMVDFTDGVPDLGENFSSFVISPVMIAEQYKFMLYDHEGNLYKVIDATYDEVYDFSIVRAGYDFAGWKDKSGQVVLEYMEGVLAVDFTPNVESDGEVELFVEWQAAKGNISFDSRGGTKVLLDDDYQSVYLEFLPSINIPVLAGYSFDGFYDDEGVQYIDKNGTGVAIWNKIDSFATLYAQWTAKPLTVTYIYNDHTNLTKTDSFDVENNIKLSEENITKVGYTFMGWYNAQTGGTRLVNTQGIYEDLTVYGRWSENVYVIPARTNVNITVDNRAINLNNISASYPSRVITLSSGVKNLFIYGSTNVKLVLIAKAEHINLYLRDVNYTGLSGQSALQANNITLFVITNSSITGAKGDVGYNGNKGNDGNNHGVPSNGSPHAKDGGNGLNGFVGKNGQIAVEANEIEILGAEGAKLTLNGGDGGTGGIGGFGGNGAYGNDGQTGGGKDNGVSGGHGGDGGSGGKGGNGAYAIKAYKIIINTTVILNGGNGGLGGKGGHGGNGGYGGKGANNIGFLFITANFAGKGGDGGDCGFGGEGGAGGQGSYCLYGELILQNDATCYKIDGERAAEGAKGENGKGGKGGNGGDGPIGGANGKNGYGYVA